MLAALLPLLVGTSVFAAVSGTSAYLQAPAAPGFNWGGASSHFDPNEAFRRDFAEGIVIDTTATVSSLRFWGKNLDTPPVPSTQFRISVWRSDGVSFNNIAGSPGTLHFEQIVSISDPRMQVIPYQGPLVGSDQYEIDFGAAFTMNANERYWLSIAGSVEPDQYFRWAWADAPVGSGYTSVYNIFSSNSWFTFQPNGFATAGQAFELFIVPSPAPATLLAAGLLVLIRRKRGPMRA